MADIKTADQLNLPTPEVEYHNIVAQPTEHQQEIYYIASMPFMRAWYSEVRK
ncbi:hypothetical protein [Faecalimonas umbilicata]|uniref:hypothetical protein n=1 Tax=Faecalimonas umbilicata TaxID=1912855 RepID=UPI001402CE43